MARIRTIKPEFFTDSKVTSLTPLARLFYVSMWCEADREGRLEWEPETLKDRYFPRDKCDLEKLANELTQKGRIRFYTVGDKTYCDIPTFGKNQVINNREQQSSIPPYSGDACVTRESGDSDAACGKEGRKGRERKETPIVPVGDEYPQEFLDLVAAYPKREGTNPLPRAFKAFNAAKGRGATITQLTAAATGYAKTDVAGTKFCQQLATWLNGDEWKSAPIQLVPSTFDPERVQWVARCKGFTRSKFWNLDQWGPRPNEDGTRVPQDVLMETEAHLEPPEGLERRDITMAG